MTAIERRKAIADLIDIRDRMEVVKTNIVLLWALALTVFLLCIISMSIAEHYYQSGFNVGAQESIAANCMPFDSATFLCKSTATNTN